MRNRSSHSGPRAAVGLLTAALCLCGGADAPGADDSPTANALPFTLTFTPKVYDGAQPALPGMQGFVHAELGDKWLIVGGRTTLGLHTFNAAPAKNFKPSSANSNLVVVQPATGKVWTAPLCALGFALAGPLGSTNQQACFDRDEGMLYVAGGYGWNADKSDMITFGALVRIPVGSVIDAITSGASAADMAAKLKSLIQVTTHDKLAVTGGGLKKAGNRLYLMFGQRFDGQYYAFNTKNPRQEYTEIVRLFQVTKSPFGVTYAGDLPPSSDPTHPYHRRDGSFIDDVDPATGQARFAMLGGVFIPGTTSGYTQPIYISDNGGQPSITVDLKFEQKFSQYECPVFVINDAAGKAVYRTLFGGISHYYFHQTDMQQTVFKLVETQNRADGVPFIGDISTTVQRADGTSAQFVLPDAIPMTAIPQWVIDDYFQGPFAKYKVTETNLIGSSVEFFTNPALIDQGKVDKNEVVLLDKFTDGESAIVGHVYGGIAAVFPYALIPSHGTFASNTVFEVRLTRKPSAAYPADKAKEACQTGGTGSLPGRPAKTSP